MYGHGIYRGNIKALQGKSALLQSMGLEHGLMCQFDDCELSLEGIQLGFGWHLFPRKDWEITTVYQNGEKSES